MQAYYDLPFSQVYVSEEGIITETTDSFQVKRYNRDEVVIDPLFGVVYRDGDNKPRVTIIEGEEN